MACTKLIQGTTSSYSDDDQQSIFEELQVLVLMMINQKKSCNLRDIRRLISELESGKFHLREDIISRSVEIGLEPRPFMSSFGPTFQEICFAGFPLCHSNCLVTRPVSFHCVTLSRVSAQKSKQMKKSQAGPEAVGVVPQLGAITALEPSKPLQILHDRMNSEGLIVLVKALESCSGAIFGSLLVEALADNGIQLVKDVLPVDFVNTLFHTTVEVIDKDHYLVSCHKNFGYADFIRKFSFESLEDLVRLAVVKQSTSVQSESERREKYNISRKVEVHESKNDKRQQVETSKGRPLDRDYLRLASQTERKSSSETKGFSIPSLSTSYKHDISQMVRASLKPMIDNGAVPPTICLDHRPEPALLGEIRSVLRNLKFPRKKLPLSSSPSSANRSSASTQDMVTADSPTTKSMPLPNLITSERVLPPQPLPSHTSSLSKAVDASPPNLLATNLFTSEKARFPLGHTSILPKVGDSSQSTFGPIKEAAANLHAGDYTAMLRGLSLDDHLSPQERIAVIFGQGVALFKRAKLRDAAKKFIQCEKEAESEGFQSDAAICHVYLGDVRFARQDYPKAAKHYTTAVRLYSPKCIAASWYGMSIPAVSAIYAKCGSAYRNAHQVANAVEMYKKAIDCAHPLSKDKLSAHTSLGNLYQSLGENNSALTEYEESIRLAKELRDFVSLGWAHGNMGNAYLGLFQKDKALHHLEKSLELALDHEPIPQAIGRAYNNIGTAHQALNNLEKAEEFYNLALNQAVYGNDTPGQARAYGNLGNVLMIRKKYEKSIPHYTEVLSLSKDRSTISTAHHNRGCAYYEWAESEKRLMDRRPSPVGASQPTDSDKGEKPDSLKSHSHSAVQHSSMKAAQAFRDDNPAITDPPTPLKQAATVFYYGPEMSDCLEASRPPVIPDSILDLYEKGRKDLEKVVAFHEQTLSSIKGSTKGLSLSVSLFETNARTFHRLQDCLVNLGLWKEALVVAEQSRTRALGELLLRKKPVDRLPIAPLTLPQIFDFVGALQSCPIVYFSYTGARLLGWILARQDGEVLIDMFQVPLESNQFDGKPFDYHLRYSLSETLVERSFEMYTPFDYQSEMNKPVVNLYELVGEPMQRLLEKLRPRNGDEVQKVVVIPDSYTNLLPFTCLLDMNCAKHGYDFLGDKYSFQMLPSLLSMCVLEQLDSTTVRIPADSRNICVVGNPSIPPFLYNGEQWNLGRLPFATVEANWVSNILRATPILAEQATKSAILMRIMNSKVIHLATHGSATAGFLAFASMTPATQWESVDSSSVLLYPEEVEKLDISPALVVLSSCDSGRGEVKADGILGMARAFILAGDQAVLTTLWRVPDESACMFMQFFYQYLVDGLSGSEALQKSTLSLRCFLKYSQYIHWSGYQLTGKDIQFDVTKPTVLAALDAWLGLCTVFPRLEVVKQLESALITTPRNPTDVQLLRGPPGVKPSECVLNFVHSYHEHFRGGIFWINCRSQYLVDASLKYIEDATSVPFPNIPISESQQVLIVFDAITHLPDLPEGSRKLLKNPGTHILILSKTSLPPESLVREIDRDLLRGTTTIDIEPLTAVHATQRVVHTVLSEHHVAPKNQEQEIFEKLAEFMCGSPVLTDIVSALLLHRMADDKRHSSDILRGFSQDIGLKDIEYTASQTAAVLSDRPRISRVAKHRTISPRVRAVIERTLPGVGPDLAYSTSAFDSWVALIRLVKQCKLSPEETMLLKCLSILGCAPIPASLVTDISQYICRASQKPYLAANLSSKLLKLKLLWHYPAPLIYHPTLDRRPLPSREPEFVYVPQYVSNALCKDFFSEEDTIMTIGIVHHVMEALPPSTNEQPNFPCGIAQLLEQFSLQNCEVIGQDCYRAVYRLHLMLLPIRNDWSRQTSASTDSATHPSSRPTSYAGEARSSQPALATTRDVSHSSSMQHTPSPHGRSSSCDSGL